jgi:hypothetical protein
MMERYIHPKRLFSQKSYGEAIFPMKYELGFYIPEDGIFHSAP